MGGTPATVALTAAGVTFTLHTYEHNPASTSYGLEAAHALGLAPELVFKTLVADIDGHQHIAVVPVTGSLDLKALAHAVGGKRATMADPVQAERTTGYVLGGISPLGQRRSLPTTVDESALLYITIYISAGKRGCDIGLAPSDLIRLTNAITAPIARA